MIPHLPILALALPVIYPVSDRMIGKGGDGGRSKGMAIALIGGGVVGYVSGGLAIALMALVWCGYRSLPFFHGSAAPLTGKQRLAALIRHLAPIPAAGAIAYWTGGIAYYGLAAMAAYAAVAWGLALWYGSELEDAIDAGRAIGSQNRTVELARGAAYGLALAGWVLASNL